MIGHHISWLEHIIRGIFRRRPEVRRMRTRLVLRYSELFHWPSVDLDTSWLLFSDTLRFLIGTCKHFIKVDGGPIIFEHTVLAVRQPGALFEEIRTPGVGSTESPRLLVVLLDRTGPSSETSSARDIWLSFCFIRKHRLRLGKVTFHGCTR